MSTIDELQKRIDELERYEADEAAFMSRHGVRYDTTFIGGWAAVLNERDDLRAELAARDAQIDKMRREYAESINIAIKENVQRDAQITALREALKSARDSVGGAHIYLTGRNTTHNAVSVVMALSDAIAEMDNALSAVPAPAPDDGSVRCTCEWAASDDGTGTSNAFGVSATGATPTDAVASWLMRMRNEVEIVTLEVRRVQKVSKP